MKQIPKSYYLKKLNIIFKKILNDKKLKLNYSTATKDIKKWDSLNHVKIILECEKQFKIKFNVNEVNKINNVQYLINLIGKFK
tara:strand:- start:572 stop:820 length:249 start_codon:yes stop_codon:yes gene_type:complete